MRLYSLTCITTAAVAFTTLSATSIAQVSSDTSSFTLSEKTSVPGAILKPGQYTIHIVDHLTDRNIIRVDSSTGSDHSIFLGVVSPKLGQSSGPVTWDAKLNGTAAMRGFSFPAGSTIEFVYPKNDAAALAKANPEPVIAIDPESEGKPALKNLSKDDMQIVSLWMLTLTTAGADGKIPALAAKHYEGTQTAQASAAAPPSAPAPSAMADASAPAPTQVASLEAPPVAPSAPVQAAPKRKPVVGTLPKTGSNLSLLPLASLVSFFLAAGVHLGRRRSESTQ